MSYIDGFVLAVPTANKQKFIAHATRFDSVFIEHGATRVVECWGTDVPRGKTTDFQGAVQATEDETVGFSWIEWPDKARRDNVMQRMDELGKTDARFDPAKNPMPFDGKRMIYGGFEPIVEQGEHTRGSYIQGFIIPVPSGKREAYRKMAEDAWPMFSGLGALRVVEAWGDDVPDGKVTDFRRAVKAEPDEKIVFSFMEWPSREVCEVTGGPFKFSPTEPGKTHMGLEEAHRDLNISPEEFDEVAAEPGRSLGFAKVPAREKGEVLAAFAAHKNEVTAGYKTT